MKEFITDKAIVRIHFGNLSEEERNKVFRDAAVNFYTSVEKSRKDGERCQILSMTSMPGMQNRTGS